MAEALWKQLTDQKNVDPSLGWALFEVENDQVVVVAQGVGLESFRGAFDDNKIQWGVLKVSGVDQQDNVTSSRAKYVQVNWVGPNVPARKRSGALAGKSAIAQVLKGVQVTIDATSADDFTGITIGKSLLQCGGAHKPTFYDFGNGETVPLSDLYGN